jgi:hypothetical protein
VNERMSNLLDLAADDEGAALGFDGDTIVRRARARRRRHHSGVAVGLTAAAVAGVLVATQLAGSPRSDSRGPVTSPSTVSAPPSSSAPALTPQQQAITDACARQHLPAPSVPVPSGEGALLHTHVGDTIQSSGTSGPRASFLESWTIDAYLRDDLGVTATFVNPAHTRWASCGIAAGETQDADGVWTGSLPSGPVPRSWYGPDGFRHQAATVSWSQVCRPNEGKVCAHELYAGTFARYAGVASAVVDAPDGTVLHPVFGDYTYVFRHAEQRVDAHRPANDMQNFPSMPVTLLDDQGKRIIRYDYFPPYVIPGNCPTTGGC